MAQRNKLDRMMFHGYTIMRLFPEVKKQYEGQPMALYKRLHRLETEAHSFAERCCNEDIPEEKQQRKAKSIMNRVDALLGNEGWDRIPVFFNWDPRGYALKISDGYVKLHNLEIVRDLGEYGIICPEF